ncbi:hypothetical protein PF010_g1343 [Phytophthora fragariae]|nr:hypothetical protein PF003_g33780 [Phytophthora fragariae]KAE9049223.1 hypothetical protein PR001_g3505 [Phytophthora rubi]KAE9137332.1 hypothetical protein PF010_g1343 [Phytophthora fragariae]KAE9243005.1 hypothetical protein PF004_g6357 [Phytophthora fragariae]
MFRGWRSFLIVGIPCGGSAGRWACCCPPTPINPSHSGRFPIQCTCCYRGIGKSWRIRRSWGH